MHTSTSQVDGEGARTPKSRIFLVDDHPIFRQGLAKMIGMEEDLEVCGQATSAAQAMDALRRIDATAAVVDISLPGADGIELVKHLHAEHPKLPILVISAHDERVYALRALRAGACGYLMKREGEDLLIPALRGVLAGKVWVSPAFGEQLIYKVARGGVSGDSGGAGGPGGSPLDALSDRELEVLRLIGEGKSSHEIADGLHLSIKTVESHRLHVKEKLGLKSSTELVRFAAEWVCMQVG
jgi:DNA-binding NarL/FixJ family response regulator